MLSGTKCWWELVAWHYVERIFWCEVLYVWLFSITLAQILHKLKQFCMYAPDEHWALVFKAMCRWPPDILRLS